MSTTYKSLQTLATLNTLLGTNRVMTLLSVGNDGSQGTTDTTASISLADFQTYIVSNVQAEIVTLQNKPGNGAFASPITITLTGPVTGAVTFDGSASTSFATSVTDASIKQSAIIGLSASLSSLQTDVDSKLAANLLGAASGVASLDASGHVPSAQLPSYVDAVVEASTYTALPTTGATGIIYVTLDTNHIYRWTGSVYIEIDSNVGSADVAQRWATVRKITLTGPIAGSVTLDGSADVQLPVTIANGALTTAMVNGLDNSLQTLTTNVTSVTNTANTNTSAISALDAKVNAGFAGYTYTVTTASAVWNVNHGLNKYPSVTVLDSAGTKVFCGVDYIDANNVTITSAYPFTGSAIFH